MLVAKWVKNCLAVLRGLTVDFGLHFKSPTDEQSPVKGTLINFYVQIQ